MSAKEALKLAEEAELDLVKIAPTAKPPVCKIIDYGKYRYELARKEKEAKKKQKTMTAVKKARRKEALPNPVRSQRNPRPKNPNLDQRAPRRAKMCPILRSPRSK